MKLSKKLIKDLKETVKEPDGLYVWVSVKDAKSLLGKDLIRPDFDLRKCFETLRVDPKHHLGMGDIRITIAQQEEICDMVEKFYPKAYLITSESKEPKQ